MKMQTCANKAARVLCASVLAAGLMIPSGAALAKTAGANDVDDSTFTLTGIAKDDEVHAYQIFDADIDANNNLTYTSKVSGLPDAYDTVEEISAVTGDARQVANAIAAKVIETSKTTTNATAGADGKATLTLDSGYWLVTVTSNSGNTKVYQTLLVDASPSVNADGAYETRTIAEAAAKVEPVTPPTKQIVYPNGNAGQSTDKYSVGDTASFIINGTVPSYPADATYAIYSITDVPDAGLSVDTTSFVVTAGDKTLVKGTDYTLTANVDGTYTVAFTKAYILANPGQAVTINYSAMVTGINLETGKVNNKAYGTFNPNPYEEKDVKTDETDTEDQTYGFYFKKYGGTNDNKSALAGAEFTVTDENGMPVGYVDADGEYHDNGRVTSDANGYVYVNGLEAGTYTVTETKVPSGFQKIEPFRVELNAGTANGDADSTGDVIEVNFNNAGEKIDAPVGALPTTGGAGTIALTACGILLVAGGSAVILRSRRRNQD